MFDRSFCLTFVTLFVIVSLSGAAWPVLSEVPTAPRGQLASEPFWMPSPTSPSAKPAAPDPGSRIGLAGEVNVGQLSYSSGYDPENGYVYVVSLNSSGVQVSVLRGTTKLAAIDIWGGVVTNSPGGPWFAASTGYVYVAVWRVSSGLLSVINGTSLLANLTIGMGTNYGVYDGADGLLYVANQHSENVTVVSGSRVVATLDLGAEPTSDGYDPATGIAYVSDDNGTVSAIRGTTVVATITVGSDPATPLSDTQDGYVYVPNTGSSTVSVINGTQVIANIPVAAGTEPGLYDPINGYLYVPDGSGGVSAILGTSVAGHVEVSSWFQPGLGFGMTYSPGNGFLYVPDSSDGLLDVVNGTELVARVAVAPIGEFVSWGIATYDPFTGYVYVAASSGGLHRTESNVTVVDRTTLLDTLVVPGGYIGVPSCDPENGLVYVPNQLSGMLSVVNGTTVPTYPVSFLAKGLASGVPWSITLNGTTEYSDVPSMTLLEPTGVYSYTVQVGNGYTVSPTNATVSVAEGVPAQILNFTAPLTILGLDPLTFAVLAVVLVAAATGVVLVIRHRRRKRGGSSKE